MIWGVPLGGLRSLSGLGVLEPSSPIPVLVLYPRRTTARTTLPPSGVPYMPQNNRQIHVTSFVLYYIGGNRRRELITSPPHRGRLILANKDVTPVSSLWSRGIPASDTHSFDSRRLCRHPPSHPINRHIVSTICKYIQVQQGKSYAETVPRKCT